METKSFHLSRLGIVILLALGFLGLLGSGQATRMDPEQTLTARSVDFMKDIEPIFRARCYSCHGSDKQRGGFRLDRKQSVLQGSDSGPVILPGKSAASPLIQRVSAPDDGERMPPKGERLTPQQVAILRAWIDQGAPWPDTAGADPMADHWAFRPVVRPTLPAVTAVGWPRNPIDRFILARLEKEHLPPSPEADRLTLLRRLKFDLLGLPPTPEEVEGFVNNNDPLAYEKLVDRFLASPHYGERWARHWLDVVRFAESDGFEMNQPRPNAWPYRDYVIRAFNDDKPYDRFIADQLAGDALGEDAATGFLVGGPYDKVKSPDIVLTLQQRADELHDMVSTTGATFLGLTVGCARCHNHKFDPISQLDYYSLKAVFAGVQHGERPVPDIDHQRRLHRAEALRGQLARVEAELRALEPLARPDGPPGRRLPVNPRRNVERFAPLMAKFVRFTVLATNNREPCLDELEVFTPGPSTCNVALAAAGARATASGDFAGAPALHRLEHINDGRYGNGRSWISNETGRGWVQIELKEPVLVEHVVWGRDREGRYADRLPIRYRIDVALKPALWKVVASSDDRVPFDSSTPAVPPALSESERDAFRRLVEQRLDLERSLAEIDRPPVAYAGKLSAPEATHRLHRGDPTQKREPVAPAAPVAFGPSMQLPGGAPEQARRQALARWIQDPRNPLPARVLVNRLWHYHFGQGIVATPSDFGRNGGRPSHPELLDWLATQFVAGGWRIKPIQRLIVRSSTYRQSSLAHSQGLTADAASRLLWRYPPRRLEAEPLRDAILSVSGKLNVRMAGPGFELFEPNANYVKVYTPKKEFGFAEWRRMIYQSKPRMQLEDTFGAFDCPDAGQIAPRRTSSTTPLQALNLLNSRFLLQQAAFFAERLQREAGTKPAAQVRRGFRLAFQREPSAEELGAAVRLVQAHGLPAFCRALFNANEFLYVF